MDGRDTGEQTGSIGYRVTADSGMLYVTLSYSTGGRQVNECVRVERITCNYVALGRGSSARAATGARPSYSCGTAAFHVGNATASSMRARAKTPSGVRGCCKAA